MESMLLEHGDIIGKNFMSPSAVHLCVDFQKKYIIENPHAAWWGDLRQNLETIELQLREEEIPTIYVLHCEKPYIHAFDDGVSRLKDIPKNTCKEITKNNLLPDMQWKKNRNPLFALKNMCSVYKEPSIVEYIEDLGCGKIIISGIHEGAKKGEKMAALRGGFAVSKTALDFADAGYEVAIVQEGTPRGLKSATEWMTPPRKRAAYHNYAHVLPMEELPNFCERPYPSEKQLLNDYLYAHARSFFVRRISSAKNDIIREDKKNYTNKLAFRAYMEKLHPEITPSKYDVHHIIPISLGGTDRWKNYAFVEKDLHLPLHTFIGKQGDMADGQTGHMLIPVLPGKLWKSPQFNVKDAPLRTDIAPYQGKLDGYSMA